MHVRFERSKFFRSIDRGTLEHVHATYVSRYLACTRIYCIRSDAFTRRVYRRNPCVSMRSFRACTCVFKQFMFDWSSYQWRNVPRRALRNIDYCYRQAFCNGPKLSDNHSRQISVVVYCSELSFYHRHHSRAGMAFQHLLLSKNQSSLLF